MEPMLLKPVGKDYLWGGARLKKEYNKQTKLTPLAETWECSSHSDGPSTVVNGEFKGMTLDKVLENHPEFLGSKMSLTKELPVLVKLIDAEKDLSIQVHPDDEYAWKYERQRGKTEMWYVLDARPGTSLIYGFAHPMTKDLLKQAVRKGELSKHFQKVPVYKGNVFFIPAGTVHAIGAGALVAEIQENSNLTYRIYDYKRKDKNGNLRELHFDKAVQVMNMKVGKEIQQKPRLIHYYPGCSREILCRCKYFETERIQVTKGFSFSVTDYSFQILLCIEGEGEIEINLEKYSLSFLKGSCIFIPAGIGRCYILGKTTLLKIRC